MKRWGGIYWLFLGIAVWALSCSSSPVPKTSTTQLYLATEWDPINDTEPLPAGDIRRLRNCAEYPFEAPGRGPWETIEHQDLATDAEPQHRASDQVVALGTSVVATATMGYDRGPLNREWVRLFFGDCQNWKQVALKRTDDDGAVGFRLTDELKAGVYGLVFQATGDATAVRAQMWVVPPSTEVVAFEIDGGALRTVDGQPRPVPGAAELARWHADQGAMVVYVGDASSGGAAKINEWRKVLRQAEFPVGPVAAMPLTNTAVSGPEAAELRTEGWGQAGEEIHSVLPVNAPIDRFYLASSQAAQSLKALGTDVDDLVVQGDEQERCADEEGGDIEGWHCLLSAQQAGQQAAQQVDQQADQQADPQ